MRYSFAVQERLDLLGEVIAVLAVGEDAAADENGRARSCSSFQSLVEVLLRRDASEGERKVLALAVQPNVRQGDAVIDHRYVGQQLRAGAPLCMRDALELHAVGKGRPGFGTVPVNGSMESYENRNIGREDVLVKVDAVDVNQVDAVFGEGAVEGCLDAPAMPAAVGLADESALRHGSREELAGDQRARARNDQRPLTFVDKGRVKLGQNSLRAANAAGPDRGKRKRHTQNRQGHHSPLAAHLCFQLAMRSSRQQPQMRGTSFGETL
jgi:hypothetical protein